ncbi:MULTISPECIES: TonB-dependent receptor domain-containing protein [Thiomicrorhabdus]|uniref:TonB-dependent receptor n=1 Tax=Thiomicrorhabdus heinhorstiae TaxID=2748010 RepID=A0ABS0BWR7_9GAMM|nr:MULTISPECIES: TonB-dependent receptor [Thiomicrorhabdus]MBF6058252.1 TonB-dependent receptor [Thiomicrorhabdus heinhorstiae]
MFIRKPLSLALLTALSLPVMADETQLQPVEVQEQADKTNTQTVPAKEVLNSSNSETGSAMRQMEGVDASRMGGHGVDLFIRGQKTSQLNVLLDGAKIEGGCPNRMDPPTAYTEISSYDQITVIRGVQTVTEGSGGTGGTVLFERSAPTFTEGKPYEGEINLGTSSNGLRKDLNATVAAGGDQGYIVLQGSRKSAESYTDGNGDTVNSSYESQQGHVDLGWTPDDHQELKFSYERSVVEDALFQGASMDAPLSDGDTTRLQYRNTKVNDDIQELNFDLYYSDVDHVMNNFELRTLPATGMPMETRSSVQTRGAKLKLTSQVGHTRLDYGLQVENVDKSATLYNMNSGAATFYMWPEVESVTKSAFVEATSFFKDRQKVIMGLRYDVFEANAQTADIAGAGGMSAQQLYSTYATYAGETRNTSDNLNALLRYEREYDGNLKAFAGLSRTYRYPDATELFIAKGGSMSWIGNPNLKPEEHNQFDIGLSQHAGNYNWSVNAYYDRANNYILRDLAKNQTESNKTDSSSIYVNIDAEIYGLEASTQWRPSNIWTLGAQASLTKGRNLTDGRNLSNIAPLSGSLYAEMHGGNWDAGSRFNFATEQTEVNSEYGELQTAAWSTVDLYGNYRLNKQTTLSGGVDNALDHAYENYLNRVDVTSGNTYKVYEPGRTLWARLNVKF